MHDYRFQESVPPSLSEFLVILPSHHEIPEEPWCRILHACEIPLFLPTGDSVDTTMGDAVDTLLFYKSAVGLTYQLYRNSNLLFQQNLKVSLAQISSITALSTRILPPLTGTSTAGSRQEVVMHIGYSDGRVEAHRLLNYQTSAVSLLRLFSVGASSKGVLNEPVLEIVAQNDELYIQQPREITRFRGYFGMLRQMLYSEDAKKEMNKLDLVKDSLCPRGQDWGCLHMTIGANIIYVYNELGGLKNYRASTHEQIDI